MGLVYVPHLNGLGVCCTAVPMVASVSSFQENSEAVFVPGVSRIQGWQLIHVLNMGCEKQCSLGAGFSHRHWPTNSKVV